LSAFRRTWLQTAGSPQDIFFRAQPRRSETVAIDVSDNAGTTWRTIAETRTTGFPTSSFLWGVDLLPTTRARLRVRALDGTGTSNVSQPFRVWQVFFATLQERLR
jgi:hypothetical protein